MRVIPTDYVPPVWGYIPFQFGRTKHTWIDDPHNSGDYIPEISPCCAYTINRIGSFRAGYCMEWERLSRKIHDVLINVSYVFSGTMYEIIVVYKS